MKKKLKTFTEMMDQRKISDKDVYQKLELSKQTWSQIKNYETQIKAAALLEFCDMAQCSPYDLIIKGYNL